MNRLNFKTKFGCFFTDNKVKRTALAIFFIAITWHTFCQVDINSSGNVGIGGVTSPIAKLHVLGNGYFTGNMSLGMTSTTYRLNVNGQSYLDGNVGISTTPNSDYKLNVNGPSLFNGSVLFKGPQTFEDNVTFKVDGPKSFVIKNFTQNNYLQIGIAESNRDYHRAAKTGDIVIRRLGHTGDKKIIISTGSDANDWEEMAVGITGANDVSASGVWAYNNLNVRIGDYSTTPPTQKLEVEGSMKVTGNLGLGVNPSHKLHVSGNTFLDGNIGIGASPTKERLTVSGSSTLLGNVGIGAASNSYMLNVAGSTHLSGNVGIGTTPSATSTQKLTVSGDSYFSGNLGLGFANPSQKLRVEGSTYLNGNVGIGTEPSTSLLLKLSVNGMATFSTDLGGTVLFTHYELISPGSQNHANAIYSFDNNRLFLGIPDKRINTLYTYTVNYHTLASASDIRLKENITPLPYVLEKLKEVQSYNYNYTDEYFKDFTKEEKEYMQRMEYGFLAQEFEKIFPELVFEKGEDGMLSINYVGMIPILTSAINEQQQVIDAQSKRISELERLIGIVNPKSKEEDENNHLLHLKLSQNVNVDNEDMILYQNAPNPFNNNTFVRCYIPKTIGNVQLCVYNMQGSQVKCLNIAERGEVEIMIEAGALSSGIYTYLLIGDGKTSEAKQMILTK